MKPTLLVLAAGLGSRYQGLKQLDFIGPNKEAMIDYSVYDAIRAGYGKVVFVIRKSFSESFQKSFNKKLKGLIEVEYVYQEIDNIPEAISINSERTKPWGTGHAVLMAKSVIHETFVVINADDYYGSSSFQVIADYFKMTENTEFDNSCMLGYKLENTLSRNGQVSRGVCEADTNNLLTKVVERTGIEKIDNKIVCKTDINKQIELSGSEVVSMNFWGLDPSLFNYLESYFLDFINENANDPAAEFFLPYVINDLISKGEVKVKVLQSADNWFGITYKDDKVDAIEYISELIKNGVYPKRLWD